MLWRGHTALPGDDGWVSLHLAETAHLTLLDPSAELELNDAHRDVLDALAGGGAYFFRTLADAVGSTDDQALTQTLWDLVWSGHLSNDTLAPLRALLAGGRTAHRPRRSAPRSTRYSGRASTLGALSGRRPASGRPAMPSRTGPPTAAGRWSLLPPTEPDATVRSYATAEVLLDRYGVVTRGSVVAEGVVGGFAGVYRVLAAAEESGRVRRGYFVEGLGAAQFATGGAVDRLRAQSRPLPDGREDDIARRSRPTTDAQDTPVEGARPTGPGRWCSPPPTRRTPTVPRSPGPSAGVRPPVTAPAARPARWSSSSTARWRSTSSGVARRCCPSPTTRAPLQAAADALALAVREGALGKITVEKADGGSVLGSDHPLAAALAEAGSTRRRGGCACAADPGTSDRPWSDSRRRDAPQPPTTGPPGSHPWPHVGAAAPTNPTPERHRCLTSAGQPRRPTPERHRGLTYGGAAPTTPHRSAPSASHLPGVGGM